MPISESFHEFVLEQLEPLGEITSRKMFGAVGIYSGKFFFALISKDTLYFKVDDSNRGDYEALGMGPFRPYEDKSEVMQYYEVPIDILEDREQIVAWANKAVAVAAAKISPNKRTKVPRKKARRTRSKQQEV